MRSFLLAISLLAFTVLPSVADRIKRSDAPQILTPEVDAFINNVLAEWNTPGGAGVAVVRMNTEGGWSVETKGYGIAKSDGTKVSSDTIFSIASNSKHFTALATGLLISNRSLNPQISWTTKIASILPDWKLMDPVASAESTITDLMSHRTGLPSNDYSFSSSEDLPSLIKRLRYLKPSASFRDNLQYNNHMYAVLSYLPTALLPDHLPFARYVKEHIFDPLQMNSTTYSFAVANATGRMADGFSRTDVNTSANPLGAGTPRVVPFILPGGGEDGTDSGPGGILSSVRDAAKWLQMLLLNGQHPITNTTIIPAEAIQKVATGVSLWDANSAAPELSVVVYGGGQMQSSYRGHVMIEHDGDLPGWHSRITRFPADAFGVAVFTNDDTFGALFEEVIKFRIIDEVLGLEPVDWNSRYQAEVTAGSPDTSVPPPPLNISLPLPLAALAGTYRSPGYGADIELCAATLTPPHSSACTALVATLNSTFPAELAAADMVWAWDKQFVSYVTLSHFAGPLFNMTGWLAIPTQDAGAPYWAYDSRLGGNVAEFAVESGRVVGFGMRGGMWGAGNRGDGDPLEGEPQGETVEERSEVWYDAIRKQ